MTIHQTMILNLQITALLVMIIDAVAVVVVVVCDVCAVFYLALLLLDALKVEVCCETQPQPERLFERLFLIPVLIR